MENTNTDVVEMQETQTEASTQETKAEETTKTFTQEQVNNFLAKEKAKWEKKAEAEKEEAKKLAKMNADEKAQYEIDKRTKALEEREQAIQLKELQAEAKNILNEKGLPIELYTLLPYQDAESVKKGIDTLQTAIQKAVDSTVNERMKGTAPQKATETTPPNFFELGAKIK